MTVADPPKNTKRALNPGPGDSPKKPRRVPSSLASRSIPKQYEETKVPNMASQTTDPSALFDAALEDTQAISAYNARHAGLLQREAEDAWDRDSKPSKRNPNKIEVEAAKIVRAMREYERRVTFGNLASETLPGPDTRDMGGQFLTNKKRIDEESVLHKIAIRVPKGGLLHLHFNSELHPERLLERARLIDNLYIRSIRPLLTQKDLDLTEMVLTVLDPAIVNPVQNIFSKEYPGDAANFKTPEWKYKVWMPWKEFQEGFKARFSDEYVQKEATIMSEVPRSCSEPGQVSLHPAENWLRSKMVLSEKEAYDFSQTVNG
jgi:adenosine deaminase CECR1